MASIEAVGARGPQRRYRVRWRTPEGVQRKRTFRLREDAERHGREIELAKDRGAYVDPNAGRITVTDFAARWQQAQIHHRETTRLIVTRHIGHINEGLGRMYLTSVQRHTVQAWVQALSLRLAPSTTRVVYQTLASIFLAAVEDGLIARSPCRRINLPTVPTEQVVALTPDQFAALLGAAPSEDHALLILGAGSGVRQGEACGLTVDRVDWLRRTVRIDRQLVTLPGLPPFLRSPKTEGSQRVIPVSATVIDALAQHIRLFGSPAAIDAYGNPVDGLIFGGSAPLDRRRLARRVKAMAESAALDFSYHDLRHFYASLLIRKGCSVKVVQKRLGHKSATTTLDTYGHLWPDDDDSTREAVEAVLAPLVSPAPESCQAAGESPGAER